MAMSFEGELNNFLLIEAKKIIQMENMKMLNGLTSLQNVCDQVENPNSALKTVFSAEDKYKGC